MAWLNNTSAKWPAGSEIRAARLCGDQAGRRRLRLGGWARGWARLDDHLGASGDHFFKRLPVVHPGHNQYGLGCARSTKGSMVAPTTTSA